MLSLAIMAAMISPLLKLKSGIDISNMNFDLLGADYSSAYGAFEAGYMQNMESKIKGELEKKIKESFF